MTALSPPLPDATATALAIREGRTTAAEALDARIARIDAREGAVHAWTHVARETARETARALDGEAPRSPLHGIAIGVKDVIATADMPTEYNSPFYAGHRPDRDAACVQLLRQAGAIILGKTHTVELASIGRVAPTRNPHAPDHTPGGSSSGSAAAVADGHVTLALGTQTGGSIVRPASFCGSWAIKPSWGTVGMEGVKPFAPSLDTLGWFGASASDLLLLHDIFAPTAAVEATPPPVRTVGLWYTPSWEKAGEATRTAMRDAVGKLEGAGIAVHDLALPPELDTLPGAHLAIMFAEGQKSFLAEYRTRPEALHPRIQAMVCDAGGYPSDRVVQAYRLAERARNIFDAAAARFDTILCPSTVGSAPAGLDYTGDLVFNGLLTLLHVPCINLPCFTGEGGLPLGLTLTGPRWTDRRLLITAERLNAIFRPCANIM